jgi:hypothetical protein
MAWAAAAESPGPHERERAAELAIELGALTGVASGLSMIGLRARHHPLGRPGFPFRWARPSRLQDT